MIERLADCRQPYLIGVRHHSPACAVRMPEWLESFDPEVILLELPPEFAAWLPWLSHPEAKTPLALAGATADDELFFYPFADFSPELAALRWAFEHKVPVVCCDLSAGLTTSGLPRRLEGGEPERMRGLQKALGVEDFEALWAEKVESAAPGATAEALRQAALFCGWVQRLEEAASGIRARDLARETAMRQVLAERAQSRVAAVVGSFHAAALLDPPVLWEPVEASAESREIRTSLIPYSYDLLDSRSGYPAGIRDPRWQQAILTCGLRPGPIQEQVANFAVELCRELRRQGHPAGSPEAQEAVRMTLELTRLRGLPAPGRREFLESVQTCLAQGELLGRGRALAKALEAVLVGNQRGRLAPGTPRSGLLPHVLALKQRLKLPDGPETVRWDPLRSPTDCRRHVALVRLAICGVPYGTHQDSDETLGEVWRLFWTPSCEAMVELAGLRGVTLSQAAAGALRASELTLVSRLKRAAEAGLPELVKSLLAELTKEFVHEASLPEVLAALTLLGRIERGHVPGMPKLPEENFDASPLLAAALRRVDGLSGSESLDDVRALAELLRLETPGLRLRWSLQRMQDDGSPLMQGAAALAQEALEPHFPRGNELAEDGSKDESLRSGRALVPTLRSWLEGPPGQQMSDRLRGALVIASTLWQASPRLLEVFCQAVDGLSDEQFLTRVASLRAGFEVLSPADRERFLQSLGVTDRPLPLAAEQLAKLALADRQGRDAVGALALPLPPKISALAPNVNGSDDPPDSPQQIPLADRFRLILGQPGSSSPLALRAARALEELYGRGHGEGSRRPTGGGGAGDEEAFPTALEWGQELEELFGRPVRQEVLGKAAEAGRASALLALDPATVVSSVELLQQSLALVGGLPERQIAALRPLVARVVEQLTAELANDIRPALAGLSSPRPTRRPGGRLDLARTVAANLKTARPDPWRVVPEKLYFRTRQKRALDWRLVFVVDVSGSMEPSIIYSALMSAILSGVPALSVHFVAFSTKVIDFSHHVSDPLALLLEVRVGGGTDIAPALRYARGLLTVPSRSLVVLLSDFEDFGPVTGLLAEARALAESGARPLGLAALSDDGKPRFNEAIASQVVEAGMPVAALTPLELARWVGEQLRT